jgi:hypothetical protein
MMGLTNKIIISSTPTIAYDLGLTDVLDTVNGQNDAWTERTVDISTYAGAEAYLVFEYINTNGGFRGDLQLDLIRFGGSTFDFETGGDNFETSGSNETNYSQVSWNSVINANSGSWQRDSGGTGSSGTGRTDAASGSFYVYAETSFRGRAAGWKFWMRSAKFTIGASPLLQYSEARDGSNIGLLNVRLDVVA